MTRSEKFEALAMPLAREMYVTAFRILGDTDRTEDIVRETYVSAWKMFDQCGRNFKVWIFRILVHLCLPAIRALRNRSASEKSFKQIAQNVLREWHHELRSASTPLRSIEPNSHFEDLSEDEFVRALAKLEPDDRAVLILVCHAKLFAFHPRAVEIVTGKALQSRVVPHLKSSEVGTLAGRLIDVMGAHDKAEFSTEVLNTFETTRVREVTEQAAKSDANEMDLKQRINVVAELARRACKKANTVENLFQRRLNISKLSILKAINVRQYRRRFAERNASSNRPMTVEA